MIKLEKLAIVMLFLFIAFKIIDYFLNGLIWFWEYFVFIPEYFFTVTASLMFLFYYLIKKDKKSSLLSIFILLLTVLNLPMVPLNEHRSVKVDISILTHNKGFWQDMDTNMNKFLRNENVDVIMIQEITNDQKINNTLRFLGSDWDFDRGYDLITFSRFPIVRKEKGKESRFLKTTIVVNNTEIELYNVHLPFPLYSGGTNGLWSIFDIRKEHYAELYQEIGKTKKCKIIAGDFNTKSNSKLLADMFKNYNDAAQANGGYQITWNSLFPLFRVDYIFSSNSVYPVSYKSSVRLPSDHYFVKARLTNLEECS